MRYLYGNEIPLNGTCISSRGNTLIEATLEGVQSEFGFGAGDPRTRGERPKNQQTLRQPLQSWNAELGCPGEVALK